MNRLWIAPAAAVSLLFAGCNQAPEQPKAPAPQAPRDTTNYNPGCAAGRLEASQYIGNIDFFRGTSNEPAIRVFSRVRRMEQTPAFTSPPANVTASPNAAWKNWTRDYDARTAPYRDQVIYIADVARDACKNDAAAVAQINALQAKLLEETAPVAPRPAG